MDGHNRGPWTLTRAPQPGSRVCGDLALALKSCCSSDACGPQELVTPIQRLVSSCGVAQEAMPKPWLGGDTRRNEEAHPERITAQLTSAGQQGGEVRGWFPESYTRSVVGLDVPQLLCLSLWDI